MNQTDKQTISRETKNRHLLLRFRMGLRAVSRDKRKAALLIAYVISILIFWLFREPLFMRGEPDIFEMLERALLSLLLPLYSVGGLFALIVLFGSPLGGHSISNDLRRAGLVNHAGEAPLLVARFRPKDQRHITVLEFEARGIPRMEWENRRAKIEAALNVNVASIEEGAGKRRILLHTVKADSSLPDVLHWNEEYLNSDSFVLTLGESLAGPVTVNLAHIPHILLGGSTGSGKSVLLKLLLMQCLQKDAVVSVADFKGGVDFPLVWHQKCRMCFEENDLL